MEVIRWVMAVAMATVFFIAARFFGKWLDRLDGDGETKTDGAPPQGPS